MTVNGEEETSSGLEVAGRLFARPAIRLHLVGDLLTLIEGLHAGALDGRDVDEHVLATVIRLDEAEALGSVEPLNGADAHRYFRIFVGKRI